MAKKKKKCCAACEQGMDAVAKHDREAFEKMGWYAHYVVDEPGAPHNVNYHTHGVQESWGHKDLQVCLPLPMEIIHTIVDLIVERIKGGETFQAGKKAFEVIETLAVTFKDVEEGGRPVLRVIFPDANGSLEPNGMDEKFAEQWRDDD